MKKIEKESFFKSFLLFFISQAILVGALFFVDYKKNVQTLDEAIFSKMRLCSFDLKCDEFRLDFVEKESYELYKLYKGDKELSSYFSIPTSQKSSLKIYLSKDSYNQKVIELQKRQLLSFLAVMLVVIILSILFSIYTLRPFRNALHLTEEFIKDILHDFNTPISTLRLNSSMLKDEIGENSKIKRIENSIQTILNLQSNLQSYLSSHTLQKERVDLKELVLGSVSQIQGSYKNLKFIVQIDKREVSVNKNSLSRIIDNLLTNAAKYNKQNGSITVKLIGNHLEIEDTGKGIKNPTKIFDRFYKEQERGIGIGLHIVKKLCDELNVNISVESELNVGTKFTLDLKNII